MNRLTTRTTARRGPAGSTRRTGRDGFTLVELLVVIVVLGILFALLLPAINGALRTARNAAVSAEINSLAQALAQFKSKYGDYPPSRVFLSETGNYSAVGSNVQLSTVDPAAAGLDITVGQLASRTLSAFRRFWPRLQLSTSGVPPIVANSNGSFFYDFNGNGVLDTNPYILHGHECLVFFLGGIPTYDVASGSYGLSGFGNDPTNPFSNMIMTSAMYNSNRQQPYFQFNPGRLFLDPTNTTYSGGAGTPGYPANPGIPAYYDTLNTGPPSGPITGSGPVNFYAYFSAYGNGNYDPNDVNIYETDQNAQGITLQFIVNFPIQGSATVPPSVISPSPNPYTSTLSAGTSSGTLTYQSPQTFQIISAGADGLYGVGGQYVAQTQSSTVPLPLDLNHVDTTDGSVRKREYDNLSNFKAGRLN